MWEIAGKRFDKVFAAVVHVVGHSIAGVGDLCEAVVGLDVQLVSDAQVAADAVEVVAVVKAAEGVHSGVEGRAEAVE